MAKKNHVIYGKSTQMNGSGKDDTNKQTNNQKAIVKRCWFYVDFDFVVSGVWSYIILVYIDMIMISNFFQIYFYFSG